MKLLVKYSLEKDARTYVDFVYTFKAFKHGRDGPKSKLLEKLDLKLQEILINAENAEAVYEQVYNHLKNIYENDPDNIEKGIKRLQDSWENVGDSIIYSLEFLYKKPFPFETITAYLTTNNIFPYSYENRYFFVFYKFLMPQLGTAKHELNHFMFYYYYPELLETLGKERYELLKESLTFFSNPEQGGKPNEKPLRELFGSKIWSSLDEAVAAGAKYLLEKQKH